MLLTRPDEADEHATPGLMGSKAAFTYITMMTVSNGGDNTGVYVPLFASDPGVIPTYFIVFALMTALWCFLGHALLKLPPLAAKVERYGHYVLPAVLIAIGLEILSGFLPIEYCNCNKEGRLGSRLCENVRRVPTDYKMTRISRSCAKSGLAE
ncbi:hypothetical protein GEV39_12330 [Pseudomonas sp. NY5710]|uniref:cadmium resistance transporter n=1 Tax=Pseudomonas sp. NY5710 TaxID=2662033 RepID=UPI0015715AAB|nr:cadmium resistance transporter [Pseudomonas sp. NY5710]QKL02128.1 hypothetical protein GEV39_12330 [Pseudomonas sp. NY5710]